MKPHKRLAQAAAQSRETGQPNVITLTERDWKEVERAGWTAAIMAGVVGFAAGVFLTLAGGADAHSSNHKDTINVRGYSLCAEDERLVPVRHHGYVAERASGWVYTCKNFEVKSDFAR